MSRRRGEPDGDFEVIGTIPSGDLVSVRCGTCGATFQVKPEQAEDAGAITCVNNNCPKHA